MTVAIRSSPMRSCPASRRTAPCSNATAGRRATGRARRRNAPIAAAPGYIKRNSHGEFVFDHAWAHAYARTARRLFPKWLCAVPYTPVTGPRLLARDAGARRACWPRRSKRGTRAPAFLGARQFPSTTTEDDAFGETGCSRVDVQYHWRNFGGWGDFDDFLAAMDHKHRKNIRQERAKLARAGVAFRIVHGDEASEADLAAMHGFYLQTFAEYGNTPALTLAFFRHLARAMPRQLVMFLAEREGEPIAGALCLRGGDTLYGRYWGASDARFPACISRPATTRASTIACAKD